MNRTEFIQKMASLGATPDQIKIGLQRRRTEIGAFDDDMDDSLGSVASKYESKGSASTISSGKGDIGGKSYGIFQLATNTGTLRDFINTSGYADQFTGSTMGSPNFDKKWKELSQNPEFVSKQKDYIVNTHYKPVEGYLKSKYGLDINQSKAIQELVYSTANQFGVSLAKKVFDEALSNKSELDEKTFIDDVTEVKKNTDKWFSSSPAETRISVRDRFEKERGDLYNLISNQPQQPSISPEQYAVMNRKPGFFESIGKGITTGFKRAASDVATAIGTNIEGTTSPFGDAQFNRDLMNKGKEIEKFFTDALNNGMHEEDIQWYYQNLSKDDLDAYNYYQEQKPVEESAKERAAKYYQYAKDLESSISDYDKKVADEANARVSNVGAIKERLKKGEIGGLVQDIATATFTQAPNMLLSLVPGGNILRQEGNVAADLRKEGIDDTQLILKYSMIDAIPNGLVEQYTDTFLMKPVTEALKAVGGDKLTNKLTKQVTKKLTAKILAKEFAKFLGGAASEGLEEVIQGDISNAVKIAALKEYAERFKLSGDTERSKQIAERVDQLAQRSWGDRANEFIGGWLVGMGISGGMHIGGKTINKVRELFDGKPLTEEEYATLKEKEKSQIRNGIYIYDQINNGSSEVNIEYNKPQSLTAVDEQGNPVNTMTQPAQDLINNQDEVVYPELGDRSLSDLEVEFRDAVESNDQQTVDSFKDAYLTDEDISPELRQQVLTIFDNVEKGTVNEEKGISQETLLNEQEPTVEPQSTQEVATPSPTEVPVVQTGMDSPTQDVQSSPLTDVPSVQTVTESSPSKVETPVNIPQLEQTGKQIASGFDNARFTKVKDNGNLEFKAKLGTRSDGKSTKNVTIELPVDATPQMLKDAIKRESKIFTATKSASTSAGMQEAKQNRVDDVGDPRSTMYVKRAALLKPIINDGLTEYKSDIHKKPKAEGGIVKELSVDEKGNVSVTFMNKTLQDNLEVKKVKDKLYIIPKERKYGDTDADPIKALEPMISGVKQTSLREDVRNKKDLEDNDIPVSSSQEQSVEPYTTIDDSDPYKADKERTNKYVTTAHNAIERQIASGKIKRGSKEHNAMLKAIEDYINETSIEDDAYVPSGSDRAMKAPVSEIQKAVEDKNFGEMEITQTDKKYLDKGKKLAEKFGNVRFDNIQEGLTRGGKNVISPKLQFTDTVTGTTFYTELDATVKDLNKALNGKRFEFIYPELKKIFKNLDELPSIEFTKMNPKFNGVMTNKDGKPTILINDRINPTQVVPTIFHELFGHFGASKVFNEIDPGLYKYAYELFQRSVNTNDQTIQQIVEDYGNIKEDEMFDEWVAANIEKAADRYFDDNGKFLEQRFKNDETVVGKVTRVIKKLTDKILDKLFNLKPTKKELDNLFTAVIQEFPLIGTTEYTGDDRYSVATKPVRKPPRKWTEKEKSEAYVHDKVKLKLTDRHVKIRFYDFVNKHLYGTGADSYRRQIFGEISKVKAVGDTHYNKALELIDEANAFLKANKEFRKIKILKNKNIGKIKDKIKINQLVKNIEEQFQLYNDYLTLKRLNDRGEVLKPTRTINGVKKETKIGAKYQSVIDKGYAKLITKDGEQYYKITDEGKKNLPKLRDQLSPDGELFGVSDISNAYQQIRDELNKVTEDIDKAKEVKKVLKESAVDELNTHLKTISKLPKTNPQKFVKRIHDFLKHPGNKRGIGSVINAFVKLNPIAYANDNLDFITQEMDQFKDDGIFQKILSNSIHKNRKEVLEIKHKKLDFLQKEFAKNFTRKEVRQMSDFISTGIVERTFENRKAKRKPFKLESGKEINLTEAQMVGLYMLSLNEDSYNTLIDGGFSLDTEGKPFILSDRDILNLSKSLNDRQKKLAKITKDFFELSATLGNEVSNKDVGYNIFEEANYYPILRRSDYLDDKKKEISSLEDLRPMIFKSLPGIIKERKNSKKPLLLEDPFEAMARTYTLHNKYNEMVLVNKRIEAVVKDKTFKETMYENGFRPEYDAIDDIINDLNKVRIGDMYEPGFRALNSMFTVAVLGYKPSVALSQPIASALFIPESKIDINQTGMALKELFKNTSVKELVNTKKEIEESSIYLKDRFHNSISSTIVGSSLRPTAQKLALGDKKFFKELGFLTSEGAMSWIQNMDALGVIGIWKMVEFEAASLGYKKGTDEYKKYVVDRTETVTRRTQQTFDELDASLISRSPYVRPFIRFLSQSLKSSMQVRKHLYLMGTNPLKPQFYKHGAGALSIVASQAVGVELIKTAIKAVSGGFEDDEWKTADYWFKSLLSNTLTLFGLPGIIASGIVGGYGVNAGGNVGAMLESFTKFKQRMGTAINDGDSETATLAIYEFAKAFMPIGGPEQIYKLSVGLGKWLGVIEE